MRLRYGKFWHHYGTQTSRVTVNNTFVVVSTNCSVVMKLLVENIIDQIVRNDAAILRAVCDFPSATARLADGRQRSYRNID
jgi:hypothetical protein